MSDRKVLEVRLVSLGDGDGIPERRVLLAAGQDVIVGRASSNRGVAASADNTKISNPVISKEHALFTLDPAGTNVLIKDLRSMHGTRVDDRELAQGEQRAIFSGTTLQFGSSVIRGNATFKPACYAFHAEPINPMNASPNTMSAPGAMPQSQAYSDTKKGYGDDSSLYSDEFDCDDDDEDSASDHDAVDVTLIPDTYSSEHESEVSHDDSLQNSSDESMDEFEEYDGGSTENCCSTDPPCPTTDAAETGSISPSKDQSFCSSYLGDSSVLGDRTSSVQPARPPTYLESESAAGEWPEYSDADQSTFFTSASAAWTSETAGDFGFNMETDEHMSAKRLKSRPFSNSINDLCEPAPRIEATTGEVATATAVPEAANVGTVADASTHDDAYNTERAIALVQSLVDDAAGSTGLVEDSKVEMTGTKRSADQAELDLEPTTELITAVKAEQIATPEQMTGRRMASFTRRARDIGIGAVVGGVAMLTVLAKMGDPA
ncbi:fha domain protein [Diplodia corticola]|uniref:Fha domain protein n=1 Tax=Diplodia corticola TaxID=236234 RepID=A0A1J9S216_9PEZI|nr:fha domain protein [Diplodia corticola]OJD34615.1 fha domain protein [Diplodia corticola]